MRLSLLLSITIVLLPLLVSSEGTPVQPAAAEPSIADTAVEKAEKAEERRTQRGIEEIVLTEDESVLLSPQQLDAQDEPLRSTLHNGPLSQTVTELGGRPILSQAFDLGKASANEPYRIVRRERLRLPQYVHDVIGGVTPQPSPIALPPRPPYFPYPSLPYPAPHPALQYPAPIPQAPLQYAPLQPAPLPYPAPFPQVPIQYAATPVPYPGPVPQPFAPYPYPFAQGAPLFPARYQ